MGEGTQGMTGGGRDPGGQGRSDDPDVLRRDITETRQDMGHTLDEIEDRIRPGRIVERRTARVRASVARAKEAVMGAGEGAGQRAGSAVDTLEHAPDAALERARGNPLGAGLIAFGAGVVAAGLLPDTRTERRVAAAVTEQLEPVGRELGEAAREVGHEVADSARESARRTADHAREEATDATHELRGEASGDPGGRRGEPHGGGPE